METICAISTPHGVGGIAVLRISGDRAIAIADIIFSGNQPLKDSPAGTTHYGRIEKEGEVLDEVVVSVFRAPHSFTGEDTVEISCHGSLYIQQQLQQWVIDAGCRLARAGEFTQRAFLNGKMDLTQAEAVADLIASQSKAEKDLAMRHLRGGISDTLTRLREQLLTFTSLIELELDFADHEELEFADLSQLEDLSLTLLEEVHRLRDSFQTGNAIQHGIPVALTGKTNVGKSTLLNALLGDDRAIVSQVAGTTRDTIEDHLFIDGIDFRLIDTAGIRDTTDPVEQLGIARSRKAIEEAMLVLHIIDPTQEPNWQKYKPEEKEILVVNKSDLLSLSAERSALAVYVSAKNGDIEALKERLHRTATQFLQAAEQSICISSARHYEALGRAEEAIMRVRKGLTEHLSGEWLALDLHDCLTALGEITGEITSDEVLGNIFSKFCIGK